MKTYLAAHERNYSVSIEKSDRTDTGDHVRIQVLYRDNPEGQASSASVSVKTEDLAAALKAFAPNH